MSNKVKVLLLMPRKKDNKQKINTNELQHRKVYKKVWGTKEERQKRIKELQGIAKTYPDYTWRIYETINWRDLKKTWWEWNRTMIEWQRSDPTGKMEWLHRVHSEWTSSMMRPQCRHKEKLRFMLDKDDNKDLDKFRELLEQTKIEITEEYKTVKGTHFITKPFNPDDLYRNVAQGKYKKEQIPKYKNVPHVNLLSEIWNVELHKDGQRLIEVIPSVKSK